jgi:hypothetical protein
MIRASDKTNVLDDFELPNDIPLQEGRLASF